MCMSKHTGSRRYFFIDHVLGIRIRVIKRGQCARLQKGWAASGLARPSDAMAAVTGGLGISIDGGRGRCSCAVQVSSPRSL